MKSLASRILSKNGGRKNRINEAYSEEGLVSATLTSEQIKKQVFMLQRLQKELSIEIENSLKNANNLESQENIQSLSRKFKELLSKLTKTFDKLEKELA